MKNNRLVKHLVMMILFFVFLGLLKVDFKNRIILLTVVLPWIIIIVTDIIMMMKEKKAAAKEKTESL